MFRFAWVAALMLSVCRPLTIPPISPTELYSEAVVEEVSQVEIVDVPIVKAVAEEIDNFEIEPIVSEEEIELLALVTMAEAEGEPEEGKRLVIDTVLNRVDSDYFPDTIHDVIYQKNAFSSIWNGRSKRVKVTDEVRELVKDELRSRTDSETIFFRTGRYSDYGTPMYKVGNHYFSSY